MLSITTTATPRDLLQSPSEYRDRREGKLSAACRWLTRFSALSFPLSSYECQMLCLVFAYCYGVGSDYRSPPTVHVVMRFTKTAVMSALIVPHLSKVQRSNLPHNCQLDCCAASRPLRESYSIFCIPPTVIFPVSARVCMWPCMAIHCCVQTLPYHPASSPCTPGFPHSASLCPCQLYFSEISINAIQLNHMGLLSHI